jgi:tetratricopeptide (TPR) repeat protein
MVRKSVYCLFAVSLLLASGGAAHADWSACGTARNPAVGTLDEQTWRRLSAIHDVIGEGRYDEAYGNLRSMLERAGRDVYLQAILIQALAQVTWARGDSDLALGYFETAHELDALPDSAHYGLLYSAAQIYFMNDQLEEAGERLERWFCAVPAEEITAAAWVLKASILAHLGEFVGALEAIDAAIDMEEAPSEDWYQLKLAAQYELEQYEPAVDTLNTLLARRPERKRYWVQLAQTHYALGQDQRALAVQALAYRNGLLEESSDVLFLAGLYSKLQLPYKAAGVLEQAIRDGILAADRGQWAQVAESWYAAGELERALAAWESAGRAADDGLTDLHRGYLLVDLERWTAALEALNRSLARGGLDEQKAGEALLLRGMVHFRLGDLDGAGADWDRAGRFGSSREAARQWLVYLKEERRRRAS